jgi:uncharacterized circularly permuted ATP-grasp superfamily protein
MGREATDPAVTHWLVQYGDRSRGDSGQYVVGKETESVPPGSGFMVGRRLQFDSKSEAIAEAQRRNGYDPVDGDEQTYSRQLKDAGRR